MNYFNEQNFLLTNADEGWTSGADERREAGRKYAEENYASITKGMDIDSKVFYIVTPNRGKCI